MVSARVALGIAGLALAALPGDPARAGMGCQVDGGVASCFVIHEPGVSSACRTPDRNSCELILVDQDPLRLAAHLHRVSVALHEAGREGPPVASYFLLADRLAGSPEAARVIGDLGILLGLVETPEGTRLRVCRYTAGAPASFESAALEARPGTELRLPVAVSGREMLLAVRYDRVGREQLAQTPGGLALEVAAAPGNGVASSQLRFAREERRAPADCRP